MGVHALDLGDVVVAGATDYIAIKFMEIRKYGERKDLHKVQNSPLNIFNPNNLYDGIETWLFFLINGHQF